MMGNLQSQDAMGCGPIEGRGQEVTGEVDDRWQTIQVFVSSNSKDFHAEREVLVKQVRGTYIHSRHFYWYINISIQFVWRKRKG